MNMNVVGRWRVAAAALLVVAASGTLAACGSDEGSGGGSSSPTIAYLAPETITPRYEAIEKPALTKRLKEICPDCRLITANANSDASEQLRQAENVIADGAKVIITNPVDSKAAAGIAARAAASDVAVVSLGRLIQNATVAWSLTMDTVQAGKDKATSLAEALAEQGHPQGPIVMINGAPGDTDDAKMKQGAEEVFKAKGIQVAMRFDTPQWDPSKAQQQMDQAITALGPQGFYGVYSSNDGMAGGAIAAMKSANIDPRTRPVTGLDNDVAALQRIVAGEQYMTEFQDIVDEATKAAEVALALGRGEKVPDQYKETTVNNGKGDVPTYLFEIGPITQKNIKQFFDDKKLDAAKVCTGNFVQDCQKLGITP
ncbi:substrate-binding domain-containing protein [Dactylosporangium sp. NPDC000521]|uniref:substrate-binding domain-containing protein n=1 Tax=Dactylosporangium sp. NPDC000521 TaxID=3363975 RepID=UPI0036960EA3